MTKGEQGQQERWPESVEQLHEVGRESAFYASAACRLLNSRVCLRHGSLVLGHWAFWVVGLRRIRHGQKRLIGIRNKMIDVI